MLRNSRRYPRIKSFRNRWVESEEYPGKLPNEKQLELKWEIFESNNQKEYLKITDKIESRTDKGKFDSIYKTILKFYFSKGISGRFSEFLSKPMKCFPEHFI